MKHVLIIAALASASALAGPILTSSPYAAGSNQPTSCAVDVDGRAFPCVLVPAAGGSLVPTADLKGLAIPGTYQVVLTVSTVPATCSGGPIAWDCGGYGGSASAGPFTLTLRAGVAPSAPAVRLTP